MQHLNQISFRAFQVMKIAAFLDNQKTLNYLQIELACAAFFVQEISHRDNSKSHYCEISNIQFIQTSEKSV